MPHLPDHARHDPLLVAAYAAGDATGPGLEEATKLVASCPECAALHHDLRAIAAALPALPAAVRPRDFRLAPEQAAALRRTGWRRLLAPFAGPRFAFAGPLGAGLATLGLAGILVAGGAGLPLGGAAGAPPTQAAAPDTSDAAGAAGAAPAAMPAPSAAPSAAAASPATGAELAPPTAGAAQMAPVPSPAVPAPAGDTGTAGGAPQSQQVTVYGSAAASAAPSAGPAFPAAPSAGAKDSAVGYGAPAAGTAAGTPPAVVDEAPPGVERIGVATATLDTVQAPPAIAILAGVLLVAGLLLAGLRVVARRVA